MSATSLKNGLTTDQINKAREVFSQVSLARVCRENGLKISTVRNVLNGTSPRIEMLKSALDAATMKIEHTKEMLKTIPSA